MDLRGVCIRVPIDPPVDVVAIDGVKRIHPQFTPLDIESSAVGVTKAVTEPDPEFCRRDDVIVRRGLN